MQAERALHLQQFTHCTGLARFNISAFPFLKAKLCGIRLDTHDLAVAIPSQRTEMILRKGSISTMKLQTMGGGFRGLVLLKNVTKSIALFCSFLHTETICTASKSKHLNPLHIDIRC